MKMITSEKSRGYVLLFVLVVSAIIATVTIGFLNYYISSIRSERVAFTSAQALALAEAGVDVAINKLNEDAGYSGESEVPLGDGVFSVSVTSIDGNTKRLTATGYVPDSTNPITTKEVQVTSSIDASTVSFRYGAQVGEVGVNMNNGSRIEGNVFSNGNISGTGIVTGDATVAIGTSATVDQQSLVQNSSFNIGDTTGHTNVAQSFKPSESARLAKVSLNLKKTGSPSDLTVKIVTNSGGKPSSTVLATGVVPSSSVTASYGFVDVAFSGSTVLTEDVVYWIVATASVNASNYFIWGRDSGGGYSRGSAAYSGTSVSWSNITGDLDFKLYLSGELTSITGITVQGNAWAHALTSCTVVGDASYQTRTSCPVSGTTYPGTDASAPVPFAISDAQISEWEDTAFAGGVLAGPHAVAGTETLGPKKIAGDLHIPNGTTLVLSGPVWVEGDIIFENSASMSVSAGTGNNGAIIIAHDKANLGAKGRIDISNNSVITGNGSAGSFPMMISMKASSDAIDLRNNANGAIVYAPYGTIKVSNNARASQITARGLEMGNNSTVTYVSGLQSAGFSNGPGGSWTVVPGSYAITK